MIKNFYNSKRWEQSYPWLLSLLAPVCLALFLSRFVSVNKEYLLIGMSKLFSSCLNIGAIAIGFLATSHSIALSMSHSSIVQRMKKEGHYLRFIGFIRWAINVSFLWSLLSAWLSALDMSHRSAFKLALVYAWVYLSVCAGLCYYRAIALLTAIETIESNENDATAKPTFDPDDERQRSASSVPIIIEGDDV